jgi:hypothetical protein
MKLDQLHDKILAAGRALPHQPQVPYAFEKRVMAALPCASAPDAWAIWSHLLWRAAAFSVAIMVAMSAWAAASLPANSSPAGLAAELERAVWAPLSSIQQSW